MTRLASILLILLYLALGSGSLDYLHNLQHAAQDAREDAVALATGQPVHDHHHDDSNCDTHAQLHQALFISGWVQVLISLGLLVAFLTLIAPPLISRLLLVRIDCRGPPLLLTSC